MIFIDTNVLMDVLEQADTPEAHWSRAVVASRAGAQPLVTNLIVAAELSGQMAATEELGATLTDADVSLIDLDLTTAYRAGIAFRTYRERGGTRAAILPDFLIAAHAETIGATLLTRDCGIAWYFPDLSLITPETHPHG